MGLAVPGSPWGSPAAPSRPAGSLTRSRDPPSGFTCDHRRKAPGGGHRISPGRFCLRGPGAVGQRLASKGIS